MIGSSDGEQFDTEVNYHLDIPNQDKSDYDVKAYQESGTALGEVDTVNPNGHYPDTFKTPNHITFSDQSMYHGKDGNEGGHWSQLADGRWSFTPGATNFQHHTLSEMIDYFKKYEPGNVLNATADSTVDAEGRETDPFEIAWHNQNERHYEDIGNEFGRNFDVTKLRNFSENVDDLRNATSAELLFHDLRSRFRNMYHDVLGDRLDIANDPKYTKSIDEASNQYVMDTLKRFNDALAKGNIIYFNEEGEPAFNKLFGDAPFGGRALKNLREEEELQKMAPGSITAKARFSEEQHGAHEEGITKDRWIELYELLGIDRIKEIIKSAEDKKSEHTQEESQNDIPQYLTRAITKEEGLGNTGNMTLTNGGFGTPGTRLTDLY